MKYLIILASSLIIYSGAANAQSDASQARGEGQAAKGSMFSGLLHSTGSSQEQPCQLPASQRYSHRHQYDEDAYLRRISYKH